MNYHDLEALNGTFDSLSNTLLQNRMLEEQKKERAATQSRLLGQDQATAAYRQQNLDEKRRSSQSTEDYHKSLLDNQIAKTAVSKQNSDTNAKKANEPKTIYQWVSKGIKLTAHTPEEFGQLVKQNPADLTDGKHMLTLRGTTPGGDTVSMPIAIDPASPTAQADAAAALKSFHSMLGIAPKTAPAVQPKQTVRQVLNPDRVVGGEVNTNAPEYLSLTNSTGPMPPMSAPVPTAPTQGPVQDLTPKPFALSSAPPAVPQPNDTAYLLAHPEMAPKFDKRFGVGSAAKLLNSL